MTEITYLTEKQDVKLHAFMNLPTGTVLFINFRNEQQAVFIPGNNCKLEKNGVQIVKLDDPEIEQKPKK